jgi:galactonate dehydratase
VRDMAPLVIGKDPRAYEMRFQDMYRPTRPSIGGVSAKAIAGIECALIDIKAKALGISVVELFGGPTRDRVRVYWSHCGTSRVRSHKLLGKPPLRSMDDIVALGQEVVERGFTALKTNILLIGDPGSVYLPGFGGGSGTTDQVADNELIQHIVTQLEHFREGAGGDVDLLLDLNFNFKPESCVQIARALEHLNLLWLEIDMYDAAALLQVKQATTTRICTGETLYYAQQYLPYFQLHAADIMMVDVPWNGFAPSKRIIELADLYQINMAPHNYYSHLSSFISASLCAVLPNIRIMEIDIDDVPWKEDLVTELPHIENGYMTIPTKPGWGTELNEEALRAHPWEK